MSDSDEEGLSRRRHLRVAGDTGITGTIDLSGTTTGADTPDVDPYSDPARTSSSSQRAVWAIRSNNSVPLRDGYARALLARRQKLGYRL